jgi:hypothetical protein
MDREDLIITVFTLVDDLLPHVTGGQRLRQRGPQPTLADSEVIAIELVGAFLGYSQDQALFQDFRLYWGHLFPGLRQLHRTTFVRQGANLWAVKERLWQLLVQLIPHDPELAIVDSYPLPISHPLRAKRSRCFRGQAAFGRDYATKATFYGFRIHLRVEWPGLISRVVVAPANDSEPSLLPHLLEGTPGYVLGDRGYWNPDRMAELRALGIALLAPFRRKSTDPWPELSRWLSRKRYRIETVISQLVRRFASRQVWARDGWHLWNRLLRAILMHTVAVWLNRQAGQPPLQFVHLAP